MSPLAPPRRLAVRLLLAAVTGFAITVFLMRALASAGDAITQRLLGATSGALVGPVIGVFVWLTVLLVPLVLWRRRKPIHPRAERTVLALAVAGFTIQSYARSLRSESGWFHGLATYAPGSVLHDDTPTRPVTDARLNRYGLRGDDWTEAKPPGVTRVAVVGDSFVFGAGVRDDETLPRRLAARLAEIAPARTWEVLNLGIPGDNLESHVTMADVAGSVLDSDVVVVGLLIPNDLNRYDDQLVQRRRREVGAYSFVSWLFGSGMASASWGTVSLDQRENAEGLAWAETQAARLGELRRAGRSPPLVVFRWSGGRVPAAIAALSNTRQVTAPPNTPAQWIPGDGHPTAIGTEAYARVLADAVAEAAGP